MQGLKRRRSSVSPSLESGHCSLNMTACYEPVFASPSLRASPFARRVRKDALLLRHLFLCCVNKGSFLHRNVCYVPVPTSPRSVARASTQLNSGGVVQCGQLVSCWGIGTVLSVRASSFMRASHVRTSWESWRRRPSASIYRWYFWSPVDAVVPSSVQGPSKAPRASLQSFSCRHRQFFLCSRSAETAGVSPY